MKRINLLWDIFIDYQKHSDEYCLYRWCTTCGNRKIRDELFLRSIEELEIDFEETKMEKGFLSLSNIRDGEIHKKIVELICQKLNDLSEQEIGTMWGLEPFYNLDNNRDDFIKFVIMEIYASLKVRTAKREDVMNHLKSLITNEKINYVIRKMNFRYEKNRS